MVVRVVGITFFQKPITKIGQQKGTSLKGPGAMVKKKAKRLKVTYPTTAM